MGHGPVDRALQPLEYRTFPVPLDQLTAARGWVAYGERRPRAPRRASSVALLRDGALGVETLLRLRRAATAGDAEPSASVRFPGGVLTDPDEAPSRWFGPSPADWAHRLGESDHALAARHVVAAVREVFEQTGILLAGRDPYSVVEHTSGEEWRTAREALAEQEMSLAELLHRRGYGLRTDLLRPLGRWYSPDYAHSRFTTHFFAAAAPQGQQDTSRAGSRTWSRWQPAGPALQMLDDPAWMEGWAHTTEDPRAGEGLRGRTLRELATPAVQLLLERLVGAGSTVRFMMGLGGGDPAPSFHLELLDRVDGHTPEPDLDPEPGTSPVHDDDLRLGVKLPGGQWV